MLKCHPQFLNSSLSDSEIAKYMIESFGEFKPSAYNIGVYLLNDIMHFANLAENPNTKLVFIGDEAQLPPIGTSRSLVFDQPYLSSLGFGYQEAMLTKVERNDNGVLKAATDVREKLTAKNYSDLYPLASTDVCIVPNANVVTRYLQDVASVDNADSSILIFKSNSKVFEANMQVRSFFFKQYNPQQLFIGERMMIYANHYGESNFFNGDGFSILEVLGEESHKVTVKLSENEKKQLINKKAEFEQNLFPCMQLRHDEVIVNLTLVQLRVYDTDGNMDTIHISNDFLFSEQSDTNRIYRRALKALAMMAYKQYMENCNSKNIEPDAEALYMKRSPFANCIFAKFGYAITCHKAQGGEWEHVYTTICTVPQQSRTLDHFKWVYTAYTRSSKSLVVGVPLVKNGLRPMYNQPIFNRH